MDRNENEKKHSKRRWLRYLLSLVYFTLIIAVFLPEITAGDEITAVVKELNPVLLYLAVLAQAISYLGSGYMLKTLLNHGKTGISVFRGALIVMAAASVGLIAGGWIGSAVVTYYLVPKDDGSEGDGAIAGIIPPLFNTAVLVAVSFIGSLYLVIHHDLTKTQTVFYMSVLIVVSAVIGAVFYGFFHKKKVTPLILKTADTVNRFKKKKIDSRKLSGRIDVFYNRLGLLKNYKWHGPVSGSLMYVFFDILTLYIVFRAAGYPIHPIVLIAGYGIMFLAGKAAFFIPGGAGVIESGMIGIYSNLGPPDHICVVSVLGYRLISFWIPGLLGFVVMAFLKKRTATAPAASRFGKNG